MRRYDPIPGPEWTSQATSLPKFVAKAITGAFTDIIYSETSAKVQCLRAMGLRLTHRTMRRMHERFALDYPTMPIDVAAFFDVLHELHPDVMP